MKIAIISMNAGPLACLGDVENGGQSVVVDCLSRALSAADHDVTIFTQRDGSPMPGCPVTTSGGRIEYVETDVPGMSGTRTVLDAIEAMRAYLIAAWRDAAPDVIHAHSWASGKAAVAAARAFGIPVVQTFHGLGRPVRGRAGMVDPQSLRLGEEAALVRQAARIIATSSAEVFALLGLGASPGAIKLIPCGVDLDLFSPLNRRAARRITDPFRVHTLSRLVPDAGVGDVIEALRYIGDVELVVGGGQGDGPSGSPKSDAGVLEALSRAGGVHERVAFRGRVERADVAAFLHAADAVVCTPWYDSIGTVALEAMACATPVIVSTVGAHIDAVADGLNGIHVPPRAPRQIAYAIEALKADPSRCARLGRFGAERTSGRYGWTRIAAETLDVYRAVIARAPQLSPS